MSSPTRYRHTQLGTVTVVATFLLAALLVPVTLSLEPAWVGLVPLAVVAAVTLLFGWLRVEVGGGRVEARFGVGAIRRRVPLAAVRSFREVRNPWIYGWGVRWIPGGWMFNVSGLSAVELALEDGRRFRIGTDEPRALFEALRRELGDPAPLAPELAARDARSARRVTALVLALLALVFGGVGALLLGESRPPRVTLEDGVLGVESFVYDDAWPLAEVDSAALVEALPAIRSRTNGTALGDLLRGSFALEDGRKARVYVDAGRPPFVVLTRGERVLVLNLPEPDETRALFERLERERTRR